MFPQFRRLELSQAWRGQGSHCPAPPDTTYNMKDDPTESKNVYQEHPEIVSELKDLLQKYIREGRSTPGKAQSNDAVNKWEQIKGIMHDD